MRERTGVAHDRAVAPMRFGFADTHAGQLHFRACGAGPDIVLLPWLPASGRMYDAVMPHLARAGFRAIAFDLAGSGHSHRNVRNWTVQQYANDVLEACGSLHTVPYTVIGGRFSVAAGFAFAETGLFLWWSQRRKASVGVESLVGREGVAISDLWPEGQIRVAGEIWRARCDGACEPGTRVVVRAVDGLTLDVEPAS